MSEQWFRRVMWLGIAGNIVIGLALLFCPGIMEDLAAEAYGEQSRVWIRWLGLVMINLTLFYIPAAISPLRNRLTVLLSLFARLCGVVFLVASGGSLAWFALYDLALLVPQTLLFRRALRDELMSKP